MFDDTIVAVATPVGSGGLGVVRLSGPQALVLAQRLFVGSTPLDQSPSHRLYHGTLREGDRWLDEAVVGVFRSPHSYTGEDVVEFSCHGGAYVLRGVLESCLRAGARLADPGEFTRRSFLNGKMDLSQAEAVADLIASRSDAQRRLALESLRGELSHRLNPLREAILHLLAHLEAHLDFVEDDIPLFSRADLRNQIESLRRELAQLLETSGQGKLWREGLRVALVGKPNVGKSSLFNALLKENRAIVSEQPGTTRDTLVETTLWKDVVVTLVDTAGLRETDDAVEREGNQRARQARAEADLSFWVVEAGAGPLPEDQAAASSMSERPFLLVLNKTDLVSTELLNSARLRWQKDLGISPERVISVSATTGEGLSVLRSAALVLVGNGQEPQEPGLIFNVRQEQRLRETGDSLARAAGAAATGATEEILVIDLRKALEGLNAVTGQGAPEEVLDAVFSRFCVGK